MSGVEELTLKLIDGTITDSEVKELERIVSASSRAAEIHLSLLEQEAVLRGGQRAKDLAEPTLEHIRGMLEQRIEEGVLRRIRRERRVPVASGGSVDPAGRVEGEWRWLGSRPFWNCVAAVLFIAVVLSVFKIQGVARVQADPQETFVYGQWDLTPGTATSYRLFVRDGRQAAPVTGARVLLSILAVNGSLVWEGESSTDEAGMAVVKPRIPEDLSEGEYTLRVRTESDAGASELLRKVNVQRPFRLLITTDKPVYQPGQTIHMRTVSLTAGDLKPAAGREISLEVQDSKGNKVFARRLETSSFGIASVDFVLADQVNQGTYTVAAVMGDARSERTVTVERYTLPKYRIDARTDRSFYAPGETVRATLTAQYHFGRPVADAEVSVSALDFVAGFREFFSLAGQTNGEGVYTFEIPLRESYAGIDLKRGDALVALDLTVTDGAGQSETKRIDLTVTSRPIRVDLIPEAGELKRNVENRLYVVTSYADGRPARTTVDLSIGRWDPRVFSGIETSELGIAEVLVSPLQPQVGNGLAGDDGEETSVKVRRSDRSLPIEIQAGDGSGTRIQVVRNVPLDRQVESFVLRTDKNVYEAGETVWISLVSAKGLADVFVDVIHQGRTVLTARTEVFNWQGAVEFDLPPDLFGTLEINAYRLTVEGEIVGDRQLIQVNQANGLEIAAAIDRETHRPGEEAVVDFRVTDGNNRPVQAALGLACVDEAVFALTEMHPGLERIYFMLQEELLRPRYEIHATLPAGPRQTVIAEIPGDRAAEADISQALSVLFSAAAGGDEVERAESETFAERNAELRSEKNEFYDRVYNVVAYVPATVFFILVLPLIVYALYRLVARTSSIGVTQRDSTILRSEVWTLTNWWGAALVILPLFLLLDRTSRPGTLTGIVIFFCFLLLVVGGITLLVVWIKRVRRLRASQAAPLFRKLVLVLPVAFPVAVMAQLFLVAPGGGSLAMDADAAVIVCAAVWITAIVTAGALAVSARVVVEKTSVLAWFGVCLGRTALAGVPIALVVLFGSLQLLSPYFGGLRGGLPIPTQNMILSESSVPRWESESTAEGKEEIISETGSEPRVRRDFPETLFWQPELITDETGRARVTIPLADSITTWRLSTSAVSREGALGSVTTPIVVFQDFFVDIDFPVALTQNDRVSVPVALYNYLDRAQTVTLEVEEEPWFELEGEASRKVHVGARSVEGARFVIKALEPGPHSLLVRAQGSRLSDAVERAVTVTPDGRPVRETWSGILDSAAAPVQNREFLIPSDALLGASDLYVKVYPGAFSQVVEGLESILRLPHGCFEQTSSTTYPNILALAYMRATDQVRPAIEMRALEYINLGYQRLLSFEVDGGGFDWFGEPPADVTLTAYGLMEFCDMACVYEIDAALIDRTRRWLLKQQNGDGTFRVSSHGVHSALARGSDEKLRTTAYVAWALAESIAADFKGRAAPTNRDRRRLTVSLDLIAEGATGTEDPYTLALCANALIAGGRTDEAVEVLDWLHGFRQTDEGLIHWSSAGEGATFSRGDVLAIETTALAAAAYLEAGFAVDDAHKALAWLIVRKDAGGTWFSTQATVLALRALLLGAQQTETANAPVTVAVTVNDSDPSVLRITPETSDVVHLIDLRRLVRPGDNRISLALEGDGRFGFQVAASHHVPWQPAERLADKELSIDVAYDRTRLAADDLLVASVTVLYNRPGIAKMTIVDLGIPPGFSLVIESLEETAAKGVIERFTATARQVIVYFRELPGGEPVTFDVAFRARYPVKVKTAATKVYQYYEPELRDETEPVEIEVR